MMLSSFCNKSKLFINRKKHVELLLKNAFSVNRHKTSLSPSAYLLMTIPVATFGLGTWQVYRRRWKLDLIDSLNEKIKQSPIHLPQDLDEIKKLEYRKVKIRGKFDHTNEMYITPRSLITPQEQKGGGIFSQKDNTVGSWVITPFIISDSGVRILVNRGWVQRSKTNPLTRQEAQIDEEIDLVGVIRSTEKRQPFGLKNDPESWHWHHRDIEGMAEKLNTSPIYIDADYRSTVPGGPIGGQTRVNLRNEHLSYIVTWYGLCIITSYLCYTLIFKRKPLL